MSNTTTTQTVNRELAEQLRRAQEEFLKSITKGNDVSRNYEPRCLCGEKATIVHGTIGNVCGKCLHEATK